MGVSEMGKDTVKFENGLTVICDGSDGLVWNVGVYHVGRVMVAGYDGAGCAQYMEVVASMADFQNDCKSYDGTLINLLPPDVFRAAVAAFVDGLLRDGVSDE